MADAETTKQEKKPKLDVGGMSRAVGGALAKGVGFFVVALGAVVVGGYVDRWLHPPQEFVQAADGKLTLKAPPKRVAEQKKKKEEPPKPALYAGFDPPLIVNFDEEDAVRFLQLQIEVLARDPKVVDAVKLHSPAIRNNMLMLMNGRDYKSLMSREGKEQLRKDLLKEVQRILERETGEPGIEDLFFTSFVVQ